MHSRAQILYDSVGYYMHCIHQSVRPCCLPVPALTEHTSLSRGLQTSLIFQLLDVCKGDGKINPTYCFDCSHCINGKETKNFSYTKHASLCFGDLVFSKTADTTYKVYYLFNVNHFTILLCHFLCIFQILLVSLISVQAHR